MEPKPYSQEEACKLVVEHLRTMAAYWAEIPNLSTKERVEGMAFSCLTMIDGSSPLPGFALTPIVDDVDVTCCQESGEPYFDPSRPINLPYSLHDMFYESPEVVFGPGELVPAPSTWIELQGLEHCIVDMARAELQNIHLITASAKADTSSEQKDEVANALQRLTAYTALAHSRDSTLSANAIAALQVIESEAAAEIAQFNS